MAETHAPYDNIDQLREEIRALREEQHNLTKQLANGDRKRESRTEGNNDQNQNHEPETQKTRHPYRKVLLIAGAIVVLAAALIWWLNARHYEDTDDAQVDGHISGIAARVAGTVTAVYFDENQFVKAGQVIADLDPRDARVAVEQARSQLAQAQAQTQAEQPNVPVTEVTNQTNISTTSSDVESAQAGVAAAERDYDAAVARIAESEANSAKAQADVERYRPLAEKDEVPQEQFAQVVANAKALAAGLDANRATAQSALKQVDQRKAQLAEAQKRFEEAQKNAPKQIAIRQANIASRESAAQAERARLDQALLNLSYCRITTPVSGIVAKRAAEVGEHVSPGQQILLIAETGDMWVTANFRETQLQRMRPQQSVRVHVDALGKDFDGYVESMPASTGAITSILPPENATGNFVKVVQRLPVRIRFKPGQSGLDELRPGMSVEPKVRVQ